MSHYMSQRMGYLATKELAQSIRNNSFVVDPNLDEYTNDFLSFISRRQSLPKLSPSIHAKDFISYWKSSRERTSSSLSGRHFGHYKAAAHNDRLAEIHATFAHVISLSASCPSR